MSRRRYAFALERVFFAATRLDGRKPPADEFVLASLDHIALSHYYQLLGTLHGLQADPG